MKYVYLFFALLISGTQVGKAREAASYKEGSGITMGSESKEFIGLKLAEVEERSEPFDIRFTSQVYRESGEMSQNAGELSGFAYASAWVDPSVADRLKSGTPLLVYGNENTTGTIIQLDQTMSANGGQIEALIQIQDKDQIWKIGDFVHVSPMLERGDSVAMIPRSALLETAYGTFVFVVNGKYFIRTEVKVGSRYGDLFEITDGLYGGDVVVVQPVETLYLIELRATKGGGHCH